MRNSAPWIAHWTPKANARMRLFCFPYAGGGPGVFREWARLFSEPVDVLPVQLPGREARCGETPFGSMDQLIADLVPGLHEYLNTPFAFFGHSMGALVAFETARALGRASYPEPCHLFVSGRRGPSRPNPQPSVHMLPDQEFLREVMSYDGTPAEIMQCPEVLDFYLPLLRADFALCETYVYTPGPPLDLPITVYGGEHDAEVSYQDLQAWEAETAQSFHLRVFPGDHFFLKSHCAAVVRTIQADLSPLLSSDCAVAGL